MRSGCVLILAGSLLLGACSSDGRGGDTSTSPSSSGSSAVVTTTTRSTTTSVSSASTTSTSSPATATTTTVATPASLQPVAQQLIDAYDATVASILADPRAASDPSNSSVKAYLALFPEGSTFASGTVSFWASEGAAGRFYRPGPRGKLQSSTVQSVEVRSPSEAVATVCATTSMQVVDAAGNPIEAQGGTTGVAVTLTLVGDRWLLRDLTQQVTVACPKPGAGA